MHIELLNPADSTRYLVDVELPADSTAPFPNDIGLAEYRFDALGRDEFREDRTVSIGGMLNEPGTSGLRTGMTLRDLVFNSPRL